MKFNVYAIKDLEKGEFAAPFFVPQEQSVEFVKIDFKRLIEKGDSEISYFPDRFELHHIAVYDGSCAEFENNTAYIGTLVVKGIDYARPEYLEALAKAKAEMTN